MLVKKVYGEWAMVNGEWSMVNGQWSIGNREYFINNVQKTFDFELLLTEKIKNSPFTIAHSRLTIHQ